MDWDEFPNYLGQALVALAVMGPLAYCTAHVEGPVTGNALVLECIKQRGDWKSGGWNSSAHCDFSKERKANE